jgi:hypothetical protein
LPVSKRGAVVAVHKLIGTASTLCLALAAVAGTVGCGGGGDGQAPGAEAGGGTDTGRTSQETRTRPDQVAAVKSLTDPRGDTQAPELDIVEASASHDKTHVRITLALAQAPTDRGRYGAVVSCGESRMLAYELRDGHPSFSAADVAGDGDALLAEGRVDGTAVTIEFPMVCPDGLKASFFAESKRTDLNAVTDYVPDEGSKSSWILVP